MKNFRKKSMLLLSILSVLFLASCGEDLIEPKKEIPVATYGEGDENPPPPPKGGN